MKQQQVHILDRAAESSFKPSVLAGMRGEGNIIAWLIYCHAHVPQRQYCGNLPVKRDSGG